MNITMIITMLGFLVAITNIVVEVLKKVTWNKLPTNVVVLIVSEILSFVTCIAYMQVNEIHIQWYYYVSFVFIGFMIAYSAMFGFDKLKEVLNWKSES